MSYARWGEGGSQVYVFGVSTSEADADDYLVCMGCVAQVEESDVFGGSFTCKTPEKMLAHLLAHRERGDTVPERAFERLRKEMAEQLLEALGAERQRFTQADEALMRALVAALVGLGEYPTEWGSKPIDVWQRVQGWGAYWHRYREPLACEKCKTDLRDQVWGPPGKREISQYDHGMDRTAHFECPDCGHTWEEGARHDERHQ